MNKCEACGTLIKPTQKHYLYRKDYYCEKCESSLREQYLKDNTPRSKLSKNFHLFASGWFFVGAEKAKCEICQKKLKGDIWCDNTR